MSISFFLSSSNDIDPVPKRLAAFVTGVIGGIRGQVAGSIRR